jgi:AraC-like DNA-binding protein
MKLNYFQDLLDKSYAIAHTPARISQKLPFFLESTGHYYEGKKYFTEREDYDTYLILYTISGQGILRYREKECILKAGYVTLIHCKEYQYYGTLSEDPWEFRWIHLNGVVCSEYFNLINDNTINIIEIDDINEINSQFDEMFNSIKTNNFTTDINISRILNNIITNLVLKKLQPDNSKQYNNHKVEIDKVIGYIEENYCEKINIDDFIKLVHMSKYHFLRVFKKFTGSSPYEYLTNYRIKESKYLLKYTDKSVNEISIEIGYINVNNFIRDFKKYVAITPGQYRIMDII